MDPKPFSVTALFRAQPKPDSISLQPSSRTGPIRSTVARSLSYDDPSPPGGPVVSNPPMQHCPAIHKLMSGSLLQPLSESPESCLCENGAVQKQPDPIQRLLINPPPVTGVSPTMQGECGVGPHIQPKPKVSGSTQAQQFLYVPANKAPPAGVGGGVVSPHELLQRLTVVQKEQELNPHQELLQPNLATGNTSLSKTNPAQVNKFILG